MINLYSSKIASNALKNHTECFHLKRLVLILICVLSHHITAAQTYYPIGLSKNAFNLWFDASDLTTITQSGGYITQWQDKANSNLASQTTLAKQPVLSTVLGKKMVEFNGTKGLDIPNSSFTSPANGFNLAQMVYVYNDAPTALVDNRYGTYSRNANANSLNRSTPNIQLIYSPTDNAYLFAGIGTGNNSVSDLRGRMSMIENYLPAATGFAVSQLNGGYSVKGNVTTVTTYTNPTTIGNRQQYYLPVHWSVGETILTSSPLGDFTRKVMECYLAWKWDNTQSLSSDVLSLYNPTDTTFKNKLIAIGSGGGMDTITSTKTNNGLGLANANTTGGLIRDKGDYILAADNNLTGTTGAGINFTRWGRSWYLSKADAGGNGGGLKISFDYGVYGQTLPNTSTTDLYLLYNSVYGNFGSGNNTVIPVTSAQLTGSVYTFTTDGSNINNGYYTLIYAPHGTSVSQITNYNTFVSPIITLRAPVLEKVYAGTTYNTLSLNSDSLGFTPSYIKIYRGTSANSLLLTDSISGSNVTYNDYNLTNGTTYYYAVKALDASGKLSVFSNISNGTPGFYSASWNINPQPSGNNTASMSATIPSPNPNLVYYFEFTPSGGVTGNSGWVSNPIYNASALSTGISTAFRVRTADNSHLASTVSDWSPTVAVNSSIDSLQGGYTYNWSNFNNSDNNVYGLGPTKVTLNPSGTPFIKLAPAAGIHPRLFCNPEDSTAIKWRLQNKASGRAIAAKIHAFTTLLTLGSTFNKMASYAVDSLNIPYIGTGNAFNFYNVKTTYDMLVAKTAPAPSALNDYLSIAMAYEAFECWLYKGTKDASTNTYYNDRAKKLAKAETYWASLVIADTTKTLGNGIALLYDFGFPLMTNGQQDTVRLALSKKQASAWVYPGGSDYYGLNTTSFTSTSNWATWGFHVLIDLAMAGEPGANTTRTITYARANWNFLTYGIYETGAPIEGLGKNEVDMRALVALARNGYSLLGHPNLRAFATKYMPAIVQPFGYSFVGTDLLGGFDNVNGYTNPVPSSPAYGGWVPKAGDMAGIKYVFPTDTAVDFTWKNFIKQYTRSQNAKDGYYQYQTFSTVVTTFWADIFAAINPSDYFNTPFATEAQAALKTDTYFDYRGGFACLRSGFDQNGAALWFHNRTDLGGHPYANKNDIMFSALGRAWLPKISTNANRNSPWSQLPTASSGVLINGLGCSLGGNGVPVIIPGKVVYFSDNTSMSGIAGDATTAYSYTWATGTGPKVNETRNSFQYSPSTAPYFNIPFYDYPNSINAGTFYNFIKTPYSNGAVKKVFRTVAMIKDAKPVVIIADDVQRNNNVNNYKWIAQLATDLTVDSVVVDTTHGYYRNDLILKEPSTTGNRRLLVRVLNNTGSVNLAKPARIDSLYRIDPAISPIPANTTFNPRLIIESNSIDPRFKVMLYAYNAGEVLPRTNWKSSSHDTLTISNNGIIKTIAFPIDISGRTNINLIANAVLTLPVTITSFTAKNNAEFNELQWRTVSESNTSNFTIYRSIDGVNFDLIDVVKAAGNSLSALNYNIKDNSYPKDYPVIYYKLETTDLDGKISYSKVIALKVTIQDHASKLYPNPAKDKITLAYYSSKQEVIRFQLVDVNGQVLIYKDKMVENGINQIDFEISKLADGSYFIKGGNSTNKFIKLNR